MSVRSFFLDKQLASKAFLPRTVGYVDTNAEWIFRGRRWSQETQQDRENVRKRTIFDSVGNPERMKKTHFTNVQGDIISQLGSYANQN